jgi:hypothetical protein
MTLGSSDAQADLRFTLPLANGHSVVVLGYAPALVEALANNGLLCMMIYAEAGQEPAVAAPERLYCTASTHGPLPLGATSVDHIIIPELTQDIAGWIPGEVVRILKRGGTLGMGFANKTSLAGWYSRWPLGSTGLKALNGSGIEQWLGARGLQLTARYGVWTTLQQPKYLVPLRQKEPTKFFFSHLFTPYTWLAAMVRPAISLAAWLGWRQALFPYLYIVARSS